MNRRGFLKGMLAVSVAPHFLPGAGRIWKATLQPKEILCFDQTLSVANAVESLDRILNQLADAMIYSADLSWSQYLREHAASK